QRPLVAVRPKLLAAASVDHDLDVGSDRVAGGLDEQLVRFRVAPTEGSPAELDRAKAARDRGLQLFAQARRLVEEDGAIRLDALAIATAEEPRDRLAGDLAEEVPEGNIDAAYGVLERAAAALPERRSR